MKQKQKQEITKKLPSFIQIFTVALTVYGCSFFFTKVKFYSEILKILSVVILLGKQVIEEIKQIRKKGKLTKEGIIVLAIFTLLVLVKLNCSNISAILFYLKKYILKTNSFEKEEQEINKLKQATKGEIILQKKGKILYFDGILKMQKAYFLNHEGKRVIVKAKEKVKAGWVNLTNNAKVEVESRYEETEYFSLEKQKEKIISTISKKEEKLIKTYTIYQRLILILIGIYILLTWILNLEIEKTVYTVTLLLTFVYIVNPTNLLINIINNVVARLFRERIVIVNKNDLWKVANLKNYIFEKTKTLTVGDFRITEVETIDEERLFYYLNYGEYFSQHPIRDAVLKYKTCDVEPQKIKAYKSYPNRGIYYKVDNHDVLIGSLRFMKENNIDVDINFGIGTIIYVAVDNEDIGNILISDGIKYKTKVAIQNLKKMHPKHLAIISGDNERITTAIAKELKIKDRYSNLTQKEKLFWIRHLKEKYPYLTALIGSIDTKEKLLEEVDVSIILTDSFKNVNEKASIHLLDNDLSKLIHLNTIIKQELKKEKNYKMLAIFIIFLLDIILIFNYLPLWLIIIISWILEVLENKTRKEG